MQPVSHVCVCVCVCVSESGLGWLCSCVPLCHGVQATAAKGIAQTTHSQKAGHQRCALYVYHVRPKSQSKHHWVGSCPATLSTSRVHLALDVRH